jgi:hypothetical protein
VSTLVTTKDTTFVFKLIVLITLRGKILLFCKALFGNWIKKVLIAFRLSGLVFFCATCRYKADPVLIPKVPSPSKKPMNQLGFIII